MPDDSSILASVDRIVFFKEETAFGPLFVQAMKQRVSPTAVGHLLGVREGEELKLNGSWVDDPKFGRQFSSDKLSTGATHFSGRNSEISVLGSHRRDWVCHGRTNHRGFWKRDV